MTDASDCRVKLCGTASVEDARLAEEHGADYIGVLIDVSFSERSTSLSDARAIAASVFTPAVVLTFDETPERTAVIIDETGAAAAQLLGREAPETVSDLARRTNAEVWKSIYLPAKGADEGGPDDDEIIHRMRQYASSGATKLLLDTAVTSASGTRFGGTGQVSDWTRCARLVREAPIPVFLSGGISSDNVAEAWTTVRPFGVDLCSGVEATRGRRDPDKTRALMDALRQVGAHN